MPNRKRQIKDTTKPRENTESKTRKLNNGRKPQLQINLANSNKDGRNNRNGPRNGIRNLRNT